MSSKYILQYGNLAGWPYKIAQGLRERGINSINAVVLRKDYLDLDRQLPYDKIVLDARKESRIIVGRRLIFLMKALFESSLIHSHGDTLINNRFEGRILKASGIPMLHSFSGADARIINVARKKNPYFSLFPDDNHDRTIRNKLAFLSQYIRFVATDCEMLEYVEPYFEKVFTFRQPVLLEEFRCQFPDPRSICPIILHIPTNPKMKGTEYIENALERIRAEGHKFEFRMIRQLTQKQVYEEITKCDIYVDELRCGSHGVTAVEAMASGKPTITYIREDLIDKYPADMPLVNANPDTIYTVLKKLILDAELRHEIGKQSRVYVEKYHKVEVIVADLIKIYKEIGYGRDKKW